MGLSEQIRRRLIETFKTEQSEHVQKISRGLLTLEKNPPAEQRTQILEGIFRDAHSLKGAARSVGVTAIESIGHSLEDVLALAKNDKINLSGDLFDVMHESLDAVGLVIQGLESGKSAPPKQVFEILSRLESAKEKASQQVEPEPDSESISVSSEDMKPESDADTVTLSTDKLNVLLKQVNRLLENQDKPKETISEKKTSKPAVPALPIQPTDETIRVSVSKLDDLMGQLSELLSAKIRSEQHLGQIHELHDFTLEWHKIWSDFRNTHEQFVRQNKHGHNKDVADLVEFSTYNQEQLRLLDVYLNELSRQYANDTMRLSIILSELQEEVKGLRMLPLSTITVPFERMVRDVARSQNKKVIFSVSGDDTELDKRILEQIKDPLVHLLRNSVAHGLESVEERKKQNKTEEGHIYLSAGQQGNSIVIKVEDDGHGLNLDAIRTVAIQKGILSEVEAESMSDAEAKMLIFRSGFSTIKMIDDISGRGVGLDVVRQQVENLQGSIEVESTLGKFASFTLKLPLTLASSHGLLIRVGRQKFFLPFSAIERLLQVNRNEVTTVQNKEMIIHEGKPLPLAWLEDLLELPPTSRSRLMFSVVIISASERYLGLVIEELEGEHELVVKGLGNQLAKVMGIAGATVLGSGEVILVLHAADLINLATNVQSRTHFIEGGYLDRADEPKHVLVVDDSITTRTLEKNILEGAGYQVTIAINGKEALDILDDAPLPDLIISDISMPKLDGFGLTEHIRADNRLCDIPVVLVTSLDSPSDKTRGMEVGADAYIVKSDFDQGNLLETIAQLV